MSTILEFIVFSIVVIAGILLLIYFGPVGLFIIIACIAIIAIKKFLKGCF